jgi:hypothetical protein
MIFPRNRNLGSFIDIDFGPPRFNNPTSTPHLSERRQNRKALAPEPARANVK